MSHYECNDCGHTFLEPCIKSDDTGDEWYELCKLCESDNISIVVDELQEVETKIAVQQDYLNNWGESMDFQTKNAELSKLYDLQQKMNNILNKH